MQTFLPYPDFAASAQVLDRQRLGKQRVEAWQILQANLGLTKGWRNHPASVMWRGYEPALAVYGMCMCSEWIARGYNDSLFDKFNQFVFERMIVMGEPVTFPYWLGNPDLHRSHRSNLLRKAPDYYGVYWDDPADLDYVWFPERTLHESNA